MSVLSVHPRPAGAFLVLLSLLVAAQALAQSDPPVALKGYDPVSYFIETRPVKGASTLAYDWEGARYLFSSQRNRDAFTASPERYAPQLGGFSAPELAAGTRTEADPSVFLLRDNRLYVFSSPKARDTISKNPVMLRTAHEAWERK
jgi:YHS domain-containing protein